MTFSRLIKLNQKAFTIVELMIATSILATIILLVTVMMLTIGNLFQKGINQSNTQDDTRSITDQVAQDLKLNDKFTAPPPFLHNGFTYVVYCMGDHVRYTSIIDDKIGPLGPLDTTTAPDPAKPLIPHVLWRDDNSDKQDTLDNGNTCKPIDIVHPINHDDGNGKELIAANSRLTAFSITGTSPYSITVGVAYGDGDLLDFSNPNNILCRGGKGDQFCSTAILRTVVTTRIITGS